MNKVFKKLIIILIYVCLIMASSKVYASKGKTTTETTRIRKEPSTSSDIVALISINEEVEIVSQEGEWYKVTFSKDGKNFTGYIRKDLISTENEENKPQEETVAEPTNQQNETQKENEVQVSNNEVSETENQNVQNSQITVGYEGNLTSALEIKILPVINASNISKLQQNTKFKVTEIINKWCYIETESSSGWVLLSKIPIESKNEVKEAEVKEEQQPEVKKEEKVEEKKEEKKKEPKVKYVSAETLNLREKTDSNSKILAQLTLNTEVTVLEEVDKTWVKIKAKGHTGYVANKFLSTEKTKKTSRSENETREEAIAHNTETTSSANNTGSNIVNFASKYIGYKYVSGGMTPSAGFDCSGFTTYVYKNFGINLSRSSSAQAKNGTSVSKDSLMPGDILIFNNSGNTSIGHVGIYMGGNKFIHAANSQKGVITTPLSDKYYSSRYVSARRVIN